jgi:hypothetical protein
MKTADPALRVSVATLNRVLLPDSSSGRQLMALERKATLQGQLDRRSVRVCSQPFGGAIRIRSRAALDRLGAWRFDNSHSEAEQDFRILIALEDWSLVRQFCLQHLANPDNPFLEASPQRELEEEFSDAMGITLTTDQYRIQPAGFVIENSPAPTKNLHAVGQLTVRIYRIFDIQITETSLHAALIASSAVSDRDLILRALRNAEHGGKGRANAALILPVERVIRAYLEYSPADRFSPIDIDGTCLDPSTAAVLPEVHIPQFERVAG